MNLAQLYYFKKLAERQHYTLAAKELFITQPTLSDSIANLEKELGASLFIIEGKKVKLTNTGKNFYGYVCSALNELDTGISKIKEEYGALGGKLELGCIPTLLCDFLPDMINGYIKDRNCSAEINIHSGHSLPIIEKVRNEEYDLGICSKPEKDDSLVLLPILYQNYLIIVKSGHYLSRQSSIHPKELSPYRVLTYRSNIPIGRDLKTHLDPFSLNISYNYDDEISIGGIVSTGDAVGIVADTAYLKQFDTLSRLTLLGIPQDAHPIYLAYKKKKYISKTVESFADYILSRTKLPP